MAAVVGQQVGLPPMASAGVAEPIPPLARCCRLEEGLCISHGSVVVSVTCGMVAEDTAGDVECPLALGLLLHEGFKAHLLLIAQVEKSLAFCLVENGQGFEDLTKWRGFHGGVFSNPGFQHHCRTWCVRGWRKNWTTLFSTFKNSTKPKQLNRNGLVLDSQLLLHKIEDHVLWRVCACVSCKLRHQCLTLSRQLLETESTNRCK